MGVKEGVSATSYPEQRDVGERVEVCFNYESRKLFHGRIIRNDHGHPGETIIQLDDGRVVRGSECQYTPPQKRFSMPVIRKFLERRDLGHYDGTQGIHEILRGIEKELGEW